MNLNSHIHGVDVEVSDSILMEEIDSLSKLIRSKAKSRFTGRKILFERSGNTRNKDPMRAVGTRCIESIKKIDYVSFARVRVSSVALLSLDEI